MARHSFLKVNLRVCAILHVELFPLYVPLFMTTADCWHFTYTAYFQPGSTVKWTTQVWLLPWTLTVNQWAILAQVTSTELQVIKSAGKFGGRKLSQILWFCGYRRRFSLQNLECGVLQCIKSEQSAKVSPQKSYFSPIRESFLPWKFHAIRYWGAVYNLKCSKC